MIEEQQPNYTAPEKPARKPRAAKKKPVAKPVTRGQAAAYGGLGLALGQIITVALSKWLGIH